MPRFFILLCLFVCSAAPARAEFIISSAILEFTANGPRQQDIEIVSSSEEGDYVATEIVEIVSPGASDERRRKIEDPADSHLLVTPDKLVLAGGARKVLRFVLLREPEEAEHIYRVAVKPVIRGLNNQARLGLKVLVGYEVLVIIRPSEIRSGYTAKREGKMLHVHNTGNTNLFFQSGVQCDKSESCPMPPVRRVYPGQLSVIELPQARPVTYAIWDGERIREDTF